MIFPCWLLCCASEQNLLIICILVKLCHITDCIHLLQELAKTFTSLDARLNFSTVCFWAVKNLPLWFCFDTWFGKVDCWNKHQRWSNATCLFHFNSVHNFWSFRWLVRRSVCPLCVCFERTWFHEHHWHWNVWNNPTLRKLMWMCEYDRFCCKRITECWHQCQHKAMEDVSVMDQGGINLLFLTKTSETWHKQDTNVTSDITASKTVSLYLCCYAVVQPNNSVSDHYELEFEGL